MLKDLPKSILKTHTVLPSSTKQLCSSLMAVMLVKHKSILTTPNHLLVPLVWKLLPQGYAPSFCQRVRLGWLPCNSPDSFPCASWYLPSTSESPMLRCRVSIFVCSESKPPCLPKGWESNASTATNKHITANHAETFLLMSVWAGIRWETTCNHQWKYALKYFRKLYTCARKKIATSNLRIWSNRLRVLSPQLGT